MGEGELGGTSEAFYGFALGPFALAPDPRFFYHSASHAPALQTLLGAVIGGAPVALALGDDGMGKTTLARTLAGRLPVTALPALLLQPRAAPDDLVRELLLAFGVVSQDDIRSGRTHASLDALERPLLTFLRSAGTLGARAVLLLDDAHRLPDTTLAYLLGLTDRTADSGALQLVLFGTGVLRHAVRRALSHRGGDCDVMEVSLSPLSRSDLQGYVGHRLTEARSRMPIHVSPAALDALDHVTSGIPRLVNLVCDRALLIAARDRVHDIGADTMERAARALNLLPPAELTAPAAVAEAPSTRRRRGWLAALPVAGLAAAAWWLAQVDLQPPPLPPAPAPRATALLRPVPIPPVFDIAAETDATPDPRAFRPVDERAAPTPVTAAPTVGSEPAPPPEPTADSPADAPTNPDGGPSRAVAP